MSGDEYRTYKFQSRTCRQIDYLGLILNTKKTKIVSEAVDFSFVLHTCFSEDIRDGLIKLASNINDEKLIEVIKESLLSKITECNHSQELLNK